MSGGLRFQMCLPYPFCATERNQHGSTAKEERMRVEILYFPGCPNHGPAVDRVREVLAQEDMPAEMVEVEVKDVATAQRVGFCYRRIKTAAFPPVL